MLYVSYSCTRRIGFQACYTTFSLKNKTLQRLRTFRYINITRVNSVP